MSCIVCFKLIPTCNDKYCSFACYNQHLSKSNYDRSKFVFYNNNKTPLTYVMKELGLNHYTVTRKIINEENGLRPYPSKEEYISSELESIYLKYPLLPSKETILELKSKRVSLKNYAKTIGVNYSHLNLLCVLLDVDTKFYQVDPNIHTTLNKDFLKGQIKNQSAETIARHFNVSPSFILQKIHSHGLEIQPSFSSSGEIEVKTYIESLGFETIKKKTKEYEIDIFIPSLNIGIEFNGVYWHSKQNRMYHQKKYCLAKEDGIRLIQMWDLDWINKKDLIKKKIIHLLNKSIEKIYARDCNVNNVESKTLIPFYEQNHIQGGKSGSLSFTLTNQDKIVAAITMSKNKIERFASSTHVVGGFTRLLSYVKKQLDGPIETFADLFWSDHTNNQYINNGFTFVGITSPNYYWCKGGIMHSRLKFQKHKLKHLDNYNINKSESTIMTENGYFRVFDAGNAKFILP